MNYIQTYILYTSRFVENRSWYLKYKNSIKIQQLAVISFKGQNEMKVQGAHQCDHMDTECIVWHIPT